jgi:hypothetical protein
MMEQWNGGKKWVEIDGEELDLFGFGTHYSNLPVFQHSVI